MKVLKLLRTVIGYAALAMAVTVGGVAIGAVVVAPVVYPTVANPTVIGASVTPASKAGIGRLAGDFVRALPYVDRLSKSEWLMVAALATLLLVALVGYTLRRRFVKAIPAGTDLARLATAALPAKLVVGQTNRTPRAVLALAESGTTPADIARRTGLPLDAVALCLAMSATGTRQLRSPAA